MKFLNEGLVFDATGAPPDQRFCAWTNPTILSDGKILVSFHAGSAKDAPDENVVIRMSSDDGKTWETVCAGLPDLAVDGKPGSWHSGRVTEVEPGRLLGVFWWLDRSDPTLPMCNIETTGTLPSHTFAMDSFDDGHTWVNRREVDMGSFEATALMGPPHTLSNGDIALPSESWKTYYDTSYGEHHAILNISHDGGQTFDSPIVVATDPANKLLFWDNRLAVDPKTGKMIGMFWTHDREAQKDRNAHVAWGSPDGKTWTYPEDAGFTGQIPSPVVLPDGRVLAVYVHRHHPPSLRAILSENFGRTWDIENELVFYEKEMGREAGMDGKREFADYYADMRVWSFGHTEARLLANGDLFVSYYAGDENSLSVRWARIAI